jgi:hypothetical protein
MRRLGSVGDGGIDCTIFSFPFQRFEPKNLESKLGTNKISRILFHLFFQQLTQGLSYGNERITWIYKISDPISIEIRIAKTNVTSSSTSKHILRASTSGFWRRTPSFSWYFLRKSSTGSTFFCFFETSWHLSRGFRWVISVESGVSCF